MSIPLSWKAQDKLSEIPLYARLLAKFFERYRKLYRKILIENAQDYRRSRKLTLALERFRSVGVADLVAAEGTIGGDWRPFRVEHNVSGSLRGDFNRDSFTGVMTPNMLDSSSVLFLQGADGQTIRALIPSAGTAIEMMVKSLEKWRARAGYSSYPGHDTHTSSALHRFAVSGPWDSALVHPETIDTIDASCQKTPELRPVIQIKGDMIQKGAALITAIVMDGEERTFIPTSFFKALSHAVQKYVPNAQEPRLIAT